MPTEAPTAPVAAPVNNPQSSGPNMDSAYSAFDSIVAPETAPDPKPKTQDPDPTPDPKQTERDAGKAPVAPKPGDDKKIAPDPKSEIANRKSEIGNPPVKAATLKEALIRSQSEASDWKKKYETLAAESAKPKPDPEKEQLLKDRDTWTKSRSELENELKFANYERSPEYKDKYLKPFSAAYEQGKNLMAALSLKEPDKTNEFGEVTEAGKMRKGTEADWERLMSITDEDTANKFIADNFGHNAARVTLLRDKVLDLHGQRINAIEDFRKNANERETQQKELTTKQQRETAERWKGANQRAAEKFPQYFAPDPADPKGNELLENGTRLTDLAFGALDPADIAKLPKSIQDKLVDGKLPPQELTLLHSAVRNRSAAYDRFIYRDAQKDATIKELQDKLAGYEQSEPKRGEAGKADATGGKKKSADDMTGVMDAFDRLAAGNS